MNQLVVFCIAAGEASVLFVHIRHARHQVDVVGIFCCKLNNRLHQETEKFHNILVMPRTDMNITQNPVPSKVRNATLKCNVLKIEESLLLVLKIVQ